ncbi:MAG TPA: endonuclease III [Synechococcales cyanobacterium M55_K2018_004]|nr:endonuclease III [Synechococcales cyanobacterium M55_K2018_004]
MTTTKRRTTKKQRALEILVRLKRMYPDATCSLNYETPVQLLVATILSAQCTDERVNQVTPELFRRFPDAKALAAADLSELETLVRSTGFYRNKAKNIKAACQRIVTEFGGEVPQSMEALLTLPGVARKTANVVLAHAFGINAGVTVDTHVRRLSTRLGMTNHDDPIKIERDLMKLLPQADWENWSIRLIYHGRQVCTARNPACDRCELADLCPSVDLTKVTPPTPPAITSLAKQSDLPSKQEDKAASSRPTIPLT